MTVDFAFRKAPKYRIASIAWKGPWDEKRIRAKFGQIAAWAKKKGVRTGKWVFREGGERKWEVGIEVKGPVKAGAGIRLRTLRASKVASVVFDPDVVSPRVIYHGLNDWLRWRRKDGEIKSVGGSREIYSGDPWSDKRAWAHTEVQFVVRK